MSAALITSAAPPAPRDFMCVPLAVFRLQRVHDVDLYCLPEGAVDPVLYRRSDVLMTEQDVETLKQRGHGALYVLSSDFVELNRQINDTLQVVLDDESFPVEERLSLLQAAAAVEVDATFRMIKSDRFVDTAYAIGKQISGLLEGRAVEPRKLFNLVQHDFYTFIHLTNVASFASVLARELGISDQTEREQIVVGGLLHDIGKRFIPNSVLCKNGKPNEEEWTLIKSHPQRGYEELCIRQDLTFGQLMMVYCHHERLDGKGYPVGLVDEEIHPWAKLLAIVDVFDALTSARPYRSPMSVSDALSYLDRNAGSQFDREMVKCWTSSMRQS